MKTTQTTTTQSTTQSSAMDAHHMVDSMQWVQVSMLALRAKLARAAAK